MKKETRYTDGGDESHSELHGDGRVMEIVTDYLATIQLNF